MTTVAQALELAMRYHQAGDLQQAEQLYRQILQLDPLHADALHLLGLIAHQVGRNDLAIDYIRQALLLAPKFAEAHNNLGVALKEQGRLQEAAASYQEALRLKPDYAEAHNNLGVALKGQGQLLEATASYQEALRLRPDYAEALNNLGNVLTKQGQLAEAEARLRQALRLKPDYAEALSNLGAALKEQGKLAEAEASCQQALQLKPDYPEAHYNLAMTWLLQGDLDKGWPEYEWRRQCKDLVLTVPSFPGPDWDGSPLQGRTILVHREQGFGDMLQFIRYAPLLQYRGGKVFVVCHPALVQLLAQCPGIDRLIPQGSPLPPFDVYASLMSLPGLFRTTLATVPRNVPYLFADAGLTERWRQQLSTIGAFKIGISWQGNPRYHQDRWRSIPLFQFAPLARLEGVQLFSLQKGLGTEQLAPAADRCPVNDFGGKLDEGTGAFMDTAAVMKNLDLVVTSDTAIAHLAGGLGVPVWVALPVAPEWRWLLQREDSPWYPTMRLFRQSRWGDWEEVFERMAGEVQKLITNRPRRPSRQVLVEITPAELIDKITILEIKSERLTDPAKLVNVHMELAALLAVRAQVLEPSEQLRELTAELRAVNEGVWQSEDAIRVCERNGDFGPRFIELARSVYHQNDRRAALKRKINELLDARFQEEKSYEKYA